MLEILMFLASPLSLGHRTRLEAPCFYVFVGGPYSGTTEIQNYPQPNGATGVVRDYIYIYVYTNTNVIYIYM